jgi:hypothetical protein
LQLFIIIEDNYRWVIPFEAVAEVVPQGRVPLPLGHIPELEIAIDRRKSCLGRV